MAPNEVSARPVNRNAPARERGSRTAPIIATALIVPVAGVLFFMFGLSAMAFDSCDSTADCPQAAAAVHRATLTGLASIPVALTSWLWPRARRYDAWRWAHLALYVAVVVTSVGLFVDMPAGR
ncbi:hypothetical protein [Streptomyces sp. SID3343]|uniref:hypothetical protein n=1 Tax=Streptomyces sp. SID3343 TaxID=2690260 RepID=UPI00136BF717|nr:hypothetical protein [Streptomyces sp. SID3343]MYW02245.1 hypothetical protein [Streptomyces sp. SID3343]